MITMKKIGFLIIFLFVFVACSNEKTIDLSNNSLGENVKNNLTEFNATNQSENILPENQTQGSELIEFEIEKNESISEEENSKPELELKNEIVLNYTEGDKIILNPKITDPDGDTISIIYYEPFNLNGEWDTKLGDAGNHTVVFTITDGRSYQNVSIDLSIAKKNRAPILKEIEDIVVNEGQKITIEIDVKDEENDSLNISYRGFIKEKSYQTTFFDSGIYNQTVIVEDGFNIVETSFKITIIDVNQPPKFTGVSKYNVKENDTIDLNLNFEDLDNDDVEFILPEELKGNSFKAKIGDVGTKRYEIELDDGNHVVKEELTFVVEDVNFAPTLLKVNSKAYDSDLELNFKEGENATLEIIYEDLDNDKVTITYDGFFKSNSKNIDYESQGEYVQKIVLSDGKISKSYEFKVKIEDVNRLPVFLGFD